jgi:hypothetical protein
VWDCALSVVPPPSFFVFTTTHSKKEEKMSKPPAVGQDLVDYLEAAFPETLPTPGTSESMLHELLRKQGQREVIKHLTSLVSRQERGNLRTVL